MDAECSAYGERRGVYRVLVGKPDGNRPVGRPRCGWDENIKMDLKEEIFRSMDWIDLFQDRDRRPVFVSVVTNIWVP